MPVGHALNDDTAWILLLEIYIYNFRDMFVDPVYILRVL